MNQVPLHHRHPATRETHTFVCFDKSANNVDKLVRNTISSRLVDFVGYASTSSRVMVVPVWSNDVILSAPVPPGGKWLWIIEIPWLAKGHYSIYSHLYKHGEVGEWRVRKEERADKQ